MDIFDISQYQPTPDDEAFLDAVTVEADNLSVIAEAEQAAADDAAKASYYEYVSDVEMGMYDDDPNPYHGDYSEM
jgi:hypothetical protein